MPGFDSLGSGNYYNFMTVPAIGKLKQVNSSINHQGMQTVNITQQEH
jgi:hypothetical protein